MARMTVEQYIDWYKENYHMKPSEKLIKSFCEQNGVEMPEKQDKERKTKIEYFDNYVSQCPYIYNSGYSVNNGYNCAHPEQKETDSIDTEYHKGLKVGKCYRCSCPLGIEADEEDFKEARKDE